jgi:oligosaccharide repeat unit polymerase
MGYPPFLLSALWLLGIVLYWLAPIEIHAISFLTLLIFVVMVVSFSAGGLLVFHSHMDASDQTSRITEWDGHPAHPRLKAVLLVATVAMLPLLFSQANELAQQSGMDDFFIGLRTELSSDDRVSYGAWLNNAGLLSFFTTFLCSVELEKGFLSRAQYYVSLPVSLIYAVLSSGRTPVLLILAALTGVAFMRRRLTASKMIAGSLLFLFLFVSFAVLLRKGADPDATWSENAASVRDAFFIYTVGALPAFDGIVRQDLPHTLGASTFSGLFNIFYHLSGRKVISPIQEPVSVPFETNVYTGIQPIYRDFGILGVVAAFAIIGAGSTALYLRAASGDPLYILYYAMSLFPLISNLFIDQYFMALSMWFRLFLAGYLYFRIGARFSRGFAESTAIRPEVL